LRSTDVSDDDGPLFDGLVRLQVLIWEIADPELAAEAESRLFTFFEKTLSQLRCLFESLAFFSGGDGGGIYVAPPSRRTDR